MERSANCAGFTLVEMLIAVALSALIGMAGFSVVESILRVQFATDGRLERLAELQRAMHQMTLDFQQIAGGNLTVSGTTISIVRESSSRAAGEIAVQYELREKKLFRLVSGAARPQLLIGDVDAAHWQFYTGEGWTDEWPLPEPSPPTLPRAIAVDLTLAPDSSSISGLLRRVVELPGELPGQSEP